MKKGLLLISKLLIHPVATMKEEGFSLQPLWLWGLAQTPMVVVLVITGLLNPAPGQNTDFSGFLFYLSGSVIICIFSMALAVARSFLVLWAGGKRLSLMGAVREVLPLNSLYALLEAAYTVVLFVLSYVLFKASYTWVEQICIFGIQLWYSICMGIVLYYKENASLRRTIVVAIGCFWASSGWLLLGVMFG